CLSERRVVLPEPHHGIALCLEFREQGQGRAVAVNRKWAAPGRVHPDTHDLVSREAWLDPRSGKCGGHATADTLEVGAWLKSRRLMMSLISVAPVAMQDK